MRQGEITSRGVLRAMAVLRCAGEHLQGVRIADLRKAAPVPRASLYRILSALIQEEFLVQDAFSGRYCLGPQSLQLGFSARRASALVRSAQPVLREVAQASGQLAELIVPLPQWRMLWLDVWHGSQTPVLVNARPGALHPLTLKFIPGQVLLAFGPDWRWQEFLRLIKSAAGRRLLACANTPDVYLEHFERWRRLGYAWQAQSGVQGIGRVAAPVFAPRAEAQLPMAVLGIACESKVLSPGRAAQWGVLLRKQAARLSHKAAARAENAGQR